MCIHTHTRVYLYLYIHGFYILLFEPFESKFEKSCPSTPKYFSLYLVRIRTLLYYHTIIIKFKTTELTCDYLFIFCVQIVNCYSNDLCYILYISNKMFAFSCNLKKASVIVIRTSGLWSTFFLQLFCILRRVFFFFKKSCTGFLFTMNSNNELRPSCRHFCQPHSLCSSNGSHGGSFYSHITNQHNLTPLNAQGGRISPLNQSLHGILLATANGSGAVM